MPWVHHWSDKCWLGANTGPELTQMRTEQTESPLKVAATDFMSRKDLASASCLVQDSREAAGGGSDSDLAAAKIIMGESSEVSSSDRSSLTLSSNPSSPKAALAAALRLAGRSRTPCGSDVAQVDSARSFLRAELFPQTPSHGPDRSTYTSESTEPGSSSRISSSCSTRTELPELQEHTTSHMDEKERKKAEDSILYFKARAFHSAPAQSSLDRAVAVQSFNSEQPKPLRLPAALDCLRTALTKNQTQPTLPDQDQTQLCPGLNASESPAVAGIKLPDENVQRHVENDCP